MPPRYVKVIFRVCFRTRLDGEQPAVVGSIPELGNWRIKNDSGLYQRARLLPIVEGSSRDGGKQVWEAVLKVPTDTQFCWSWLVLSHDGEIDRRETINERILFIEKCSVIVHSEWNVENEVIIFHTCKVDVYTNYVTPPGKVLGIIGSTPPLGCWEPRDCVLMDSCFPRGSGKWKASFVVNNEMDIEWKLVVIDKERNEIIRWEERTNRSLNVSGQWVKLEVAWSGGESVRDTISRDFDRNYNTVKILDDLVKKTQHEEDKQGDLTERACSSTDPSPHSSSGPGDQDVIFNGPTKKGKGTKFISRKPTSTQKNHDYQQREGIMKPDSHSPAMSAERACTLEDVLASTRGMPVRRGNGYQCLKCGKCEDTCTGLLKTNRNEYCLHNGGSDRTQVSRFYRFRERAEALRVIGMHQKFTLLSAFFLLMKIVYDFYVNQR
ncbi:uncharacterized protein LOC124147312 [Haliotis rufescens]|uniref:uncharacterized protein LOC124147312 n=1 Tax=Haliotis rufescens TaxID=6454 RepID=UPI00201F0B48|nr:uncharacterized protein LOC124147312 [Haliotis rufescens]